ncbi:MAG: FAD-dependent oxidoreductase [Eubacteriales bacterium]
MNVVIIGNSSAAIGCIEGIRQTDKNASITVISNEIYHTYSRPLISYLLWGRTDEQRMKYRPDDFYEKTGCRVLLGKTAAKIDREKKQVLLDDGSVLPYDKLLIATGSDAIVPPIEGLDKVVKKHTFMSLDDAKELEADLSPDTRVLVMGAGLIGLKCVEGISEKVKSITVVDMADRILPSILDGNAAALVQAHIEKQGVSILLNDAVAAFKVNQAVLKSGKEISFDVLVIAVGVRPSITLAREAGITCERGILTDVQCKTSDPDVYAAGDCSASLDSTCGEMRVLALLPNAYMQGECAGFNMVGGVKPYEKAIPMNSIGFFDLHMVTAGSYCGDGMVLDNADGYKKFFVQNNRLIGYIIVGDVKRAGIYTSLIREQTDLSTIDFEMIKNSPQLMAFSKSDRQTKMGSVQ